MLILKKEKTRTGKIKEFIKKNKILTTTILIFCMCLSLNFILIYNFMKLLGNTYN